MSTTIDLGFLPLVDAAPLVIAARMGFAEEERISLRLHRASTWSQVRDMLAQGVVDAAQLLSVVPVAGRLGLGGIAVDFEAPMVLSLNGQAIGVSTGLAEDMRREGYSFDLTDPVGALRALRRARPGGVRLGVPFPFSMQAELIHLWMGEDRSVTAVTIPPPRMPEVIAAGEIEAFCVGEPWGSMAVAMGSAELLLPGSAIWSAAPEKVLAMRTGWAEQDPELTGRLMRAVWRACRWLSRPESHATASEMLSAPHALEIDAELIHRVLTGRLLVSRGGVLRHVPGYIEFHAGAANFPWRSQAEWIGWRIGKRLGLDARHSADLARAAWRPDLYRRHLGAIAVLPAASSKVEGGCPEPIMAGANRGTIELGRNVFFDGRVVDLSAPD